MLKIDPRNGEALFSLAMCLQMKGEYKTAIENYEKIIAADPKDAEAQYQIGLAQLALGNKKKAMAVYDRLKALDAGYADMLRRLIGRQDRLDLPDRICSVRADFVFLTEYSLIFSFTRAYLDATVPREMPRISAISLSL